MTPELLSQIEARAKWGLTPSMHMAEITAREFYAQDVATLLAEIKRLKASLEESLRTSVNEEKK